MPALQARVHRLGMVITFLRNVVHRIKEIGIFWKQVKRQGDYTDQLARFKQAEMIRDRK
jgi:hypothetical protein